MKAKDIARRIGSEAVSHGAISGFGGQDLAEASYIRLAREGELAERVRLAREALAECKLCPHECGVNRTADEVGRCRTGRLASVASFSPHFGEEAPLVGRYGSGAIFFTHCNLACIFCQNADISQLGAGSPASADRLANMMISLQDRRCHNINFVTPTHVVPQILEALEIAVNRGLKVPLVYNSGGYDSTSTLKLLEDVFDIYMPDAKYADADIAQRFSGIPNYPEVMEAALKEMHRQVGDLQIDERGNATRGLLVRHLVLPEGLAGTAEVMRFIGDEVSKDTYVNVMAQYRPCHNACGTPELDRAVTWAEMETAFRAARAAGLWRFD